MEKLTKQQLNTAQLNLTGKLFKSLIFDVNGNQVSLIKYSKSIRDEIAS